MTTFLKEYPFMSMWYYWNVLTIELRSVMLADVTRVKYEKAEKKKDENVVIVDNVEDLF